MTSAITITVTLAGHAIHAARLAEWRAYWNRHGDLPPLLITADGWLVDGHHRITIARDVRCVPWGQVVERRGRDWIATGNVVRVR